MIWEKLRTYIVKIWQMKCLAYIVKSWEKRSNCNPRKQLLRGFFFLLRGVPWLFLDFKNITRDILFSKILVKYLWSIYIRAFPPLFPAFPPWFPAFLPWFPTFPAFPIFTLPFPAFPPWLPAFPSFPSFHSPVSHSGFYR